MAEARISSSSKRESLLAAAERLMLQRGYWGTSVDDVCKTAKVTKGSFFYYFPDKEQLALAALERFVTRMVGRIKEAVASTPSHDALDTICAYCDLIADVARIQHAQEGCLIATFVLETRAADHAFAKRCSAYLGQWIELLRQQFAAALLKKPWLKPGIATELAQLCTCVIEGALIVARGRHDPEVVRVAMRHLQDYVRGLIGDCSGRRPRAADGASRTEGASAERKRRRQARTRTK